MNNKEINKIYLYKRFSMCVCVCVCVYAGVCLHESVHVWTMRACMRACEWCVHTCMYAWTMPVNVHPPGCVRQRRGIIPGTGGTGESVCTVTPVQTMQQVAGHALSWTPRPVRLLQQRRDCPLLVLPSVKACNTQHHFLCLCVQKQMKCQYLNFTQKEQKKHHKHQFLNFTLYDWMTFSVNSATLNILHQKSEIKMTASILK